MPWSYTLPPERIAQYPVEPRHTSRLLVYRHGTISESQVLYLADFLPEGTTLFYNDTRVVPARLRQGTREVFVTEIVSGGWEQGSPQRWKGLFRPGRFWRKGGQLLWETPTVSCLVRWEGPADGRQGFFWAEWSPPSLTALEVLEAIGEVPLPPYLHRPPDKLDLVRYQTFYAQKPGSVAAPTAGLHLTPAVWERLTQKGIATYPITLHVGLGTFLPMADPTKPETHPMHAESFSVPKTTLKALEQAQGPIACVGTTTLRTLESLYWIGVQALREGLPAPPPRAIPCLPSAGRPPSPATSQRSLASPHTPYLRADTALYLTWLSLPSG